MLIGKLNQSKKVSGESSDQRDGIIHDFVTGDSKEEMPMMSYIDGGLPEKMDKSFVEELAGDGYVDLLPNKVVNLGWRGRGPARIGAYHNHCILEKVYEKAKTEARKEKIERKGREETRMHLGKYQ